MGAELRFERRRCNRIGYEPYSRDAELTRIQSEKNTNRRDWCQIHRSAGVKKHRQTDVAWRRSRNERQKCSPRGSRDPIVTSIRAGNDRRSRISSSPIIPSNSRSTTSTILSYSRRRSGSPAPPPSAPRCIDRLWCRKTNHPGLDIANRYAPRSRANGSNENVLSVYDFVYYHGV
jgi:hypothetical protein